MSARATTEIRSGLAIALVCLCGVAAAQTVAEEASEPEAPREREAKGPIAVRAEEHVQAAEDAVVIGDGAAAGRAIDVAWLYLESPLFRRWWRAAAEDRSIGAELGRRLDEVGQRRQSIALAPRLTAQLAAARAAYKQALDARPPAATEFRAARDLARQCATFDPAGADLLFEVPDLATSIRRIQSDCEKTVTEIDADAARAQQVWQARDTELRAVLKGERLAVYEELGEPGGALAGAPAAAVAKAKTWQFVIGPTGKLKTYETWVITFSGTKVVSRKRSRSHEEPP